MLQFLAQDDGLDFDALETAPGLQVMVLRGRFVDSVDSRPGCSVSRPLWAQVPGRIDTTRHDGHQTSRNPRSFSTLQLHCVRPIPVAPTPWCGEPLSSQGSVARRLRAPSPRRRSKRPGIETRRILSGTRVLPKLSDLASSCEASEPAAARSHLREVPGPDTLAEASCSSTVL